MALSDGQLLLLDNLVYLDDITEGKTVGAAVSDALKKIESGAYDDLPVKMSKKEWTDILHTFQSPENAKLLSYKATNYVSDATGMRAVCFVDDLDHPKDVNAVFRGTSGDYEWHDNGTGAYLADTKSQIAAAEYVNGLPAQYGNNITVTGHSKGGNKAQYVTIVTNRIGRCLSYDGQGFSPAFLETYADKIAKKSRLIKSVNAADDPVNALFFPIAGRQYYHETERADDFLLYHCPNRILDEQGHLKPIAEEPSTISVLINMFSTYLVTHRSEAHLAWDADGVMSWLEEQPSKNVVGKVLASIDVAGLIPKFYDDLSKNPLQYPQARKGIESSLYGDRLFSDRSVDAQHDFENEQKIADYLAEHSETGKLEYVVRGALLKCTCGTHARRLNLPRCHGVYISSHPVMHELNCLVGEQDEITYYGVCKSETPPLTETVSYTKDVQRDAKGERVGDPPGGFETGHKCTPIIVKEMWMDSYSKTRIVDNGTLDPVDRGIAEEMEDGVQAKGCAAITTRSFLVCKYGGLIETYNSGQNYESDDDEKENAKLSNLVELAPPVTDE